MTGARSNWKEISLGELGKWITGSTPKSSNPLNFGNDVDFVTPSDIGYGGLLGPSERKISHLGASSVRKVKAPSVNLVCIGTIGKVALSRRDVTTNQQINSLEVDKSAVDPNFVMWLLSSPEIQEKLWESASSTTVAILNKGNLEKIKTHIPSLPEQQKIVEILEDYLSRLDAALADVKQAKLKAAQFRRSLLMSTFEEFSENSVRIGEVVTFNRKKPVELKNSKTEVSFVPMPKVSEVSGQISLDEHISHSEGQRRSLTYFENGDVIFAKITPCMENGKIALAKNLLNGAAYGSTEFHVLTPTERILPDYLRYFIGSDDFRANAERAMTGAVGQRRVPKTYLDQHEIPLPSIDIQVGIVANLDEALSRTDESVKAAEQIEKEAARLRRSLLQAAFTGQLTKEVASV